MPTLEVRRHSIRKHDGGSQLSQEGVALARRLGAGMGPFVKVVTSVVPRARETALAMGFAVDHELVTLSADPELYAEASVVEWASAEAPFGELAAIIAKGGAFANYAHSMAAVWRDLLTPLTGSDSVLLVGHSGELEAGLIACFPEEDHAAWGQFFGPCEGARLHFANELSYFDGVEILRV